MKSPPDRQFGDEPTTGSLPRMPSGGRADESGVAAKSAPLQLVFVDDDPLAEMSLRRACTRIGYEGPVAVAHDGLEALELLRDPRFPRQRCLVLLDINMPRMDGHEFLRELRDDPSLSLVPVVIMSTSDEVRDVVEAYGRCVAGYFLKPVSFGEYVDQLRAIFAYWSRAALPPLRALSEKHDDDACP